VITLVDYQQRENESRMEAWECPCYSYGLDGHTETIFLNRSRACVNEGVEDEAGRLSKVGGRG
jgi:hypothetical protein